MFIRSLAGQLLVPVLAMLLVLTTPVGTGGGVHENELLHPVLQHTHLVNGRVFSDEQLAAVQAEQLRATFANPPPRGTALGSGSGANAGGLGIALGPTLPAIAYAVPGESRARLTPPNEASPTQFLDSPEDPPPDSFA